MSQTVYCFDYATGRFVGTDTAMADPEEPGRFMIPGDATTTPPPVPANDNEVPVWRHETESWELVPDYVEEETPSPTPLTEAELAAAARAHCDDLLRACDWTQIPDAPFTEAQREEWQAYRQALRDLPGQEGFPETIEWPVAPEEP